MEKQSIGQERESPAPDNALHVLSVGTFELQGDVHKLITFLNQTLKDEGFIFGLSKHPAGLNVTVYQTTNPKRSPVE